MIWVVPAENHKTGGSTGMPLIRPIIEDSVPTIQRLIELTDSEVILTQERVLYLLTSTYHFLKILFDTAKEVMM